MSVTRNMYYGAWSIDCILRWHDGMTGSGWGGLRSSGLFIRLRLQGLWLYRRLQVRWRFVIAVRFSSHEEHYALSLQRSFTSILGNLVASCYSKSPAVDGTDEHMMPARADSGTRRPAGDETDNHMKSTRLVTGSQAGNPTRNSPAESFYRHKGR